MTSSSDDSSSGRPCNCLRAYGDGSTEQCHDCERWICPDKCGGMPSLIDTDRGIYCTDCVRGITLIYPDKDGKTRLFGRKCDRCKTTVGSWNFIRLAGHLVCRECLEICVKEGCCSK